MGRLVIGVLIGTAIGLAIGYFLFVGARRSASVPGELLRSPDASGLPAGTAQVVLRQDFFNNVIATIFSDMNPPAFPLSTAAADTACDDRITIVQRGSGVETAVRFDDNKLGAPLAFNGSYASPFGCFQFSGWAQASFDLRFDSTSQSVFGQLNIETVNLDGVNPAISALVTPIVQSTLNTRVNPIRILDGRQVAIEVPVAATGGKLQAAVSDVRSEIKDGALNLYVMYDFNGVPGEATQQKSPAMP